MTTTAPAGRRVTPTGRLILTADADRDQWLAARRDGIGSSDVPAILGVADLSSPLKVWHDKRGDDVDDAGDAAHWGNVLEEPVAREWARRNRSVIEPIGLTARDGAQWMRCTLDRHVIECPLPETRREICALEVKTRSAFKSAQWHAGCPDDVLAQILWQLAVTGYGHMHYAVLIGGNDYRQGVVRAAAYEELTSDIIAAAERFWTGHVLPSVPPTDHGTADAAERLYRKLHPTRDGIAEADQHDVIAAVDAYETARLAESDAKRVKKDARAEMLRLLGRARAAAVGGEVAYSLEPTAGRPAVDLALLAERWPDAYEATVTCTPGERLAIGRAFKHSKES
ncbi:YqaJ viral recombinase family nuclease [Streptomyces phytophilus]|uniref:YqaJ viral recombinase family nuclease n=1 Tax=Streptomyces phytophilus TaxID=722715 RepID=UPI0015F05D86|nr:YqaJ viral recombinase family protein [Streptomyces phytophilus]